MIMVTTNHQFGSSMVASDILAWKEEKIVYTERSGQE